MNIKKKFYVTLSVFVVIFAAVVFILFPYLLSKIQDSSQKLAKSKEEFAALQKKEQNIADLEKKYQQVKPGIDEIDASFISRDATPALIVSLENLARQTNNQYELRQIAEYNDAIQNNGLNSINFQISLIGSFPNMLEFVAYLENMPYLNEIDIFQIQRMGSDRSDQGIGKGEIGTNLNIKFFESP
jgi:Tfp pilus assembly protein PilO